ncbi:hypothetical protein GCM10027187_68250 [Streptosporangium sandarakinum]
MDETDGATRNAQGHRPRAPLADPRKLVLRSGEADSQTFDLAETSFAFGFGDMGEQVVLDLLQPGALGRVGSEERATNTSVFMNTRA